MTVPNHTAKPAGQPPAMAAGGSGEMCRLTIWGPTSRIELAVPAHVPIAELMPTVLGHLDPSLATSGLAHGGWVLQRLGEPPLDEDLGTAAAGLYDGDVLHLRPRNEQLPIADFDDLVDGVHTGLSGRADTWRPALTRRTCLTLAALAALLAVVVVTFIGTGPTVVIGAAAVGVVLVGVAAMLARVSADAGAAVVLGAVGVGAFGLAGLVMPTLAAGAPQDWLTGPSVLACSVAVAIAAILARGALGAGGPAFLAVAWGGTLIASSAVAGVLLGLDAPATASVLIALVLMLIRAVPQLAAWLAGLAAEPVPTTPEEFQQGLDPLPSREVLDKAAVADKYLTALLAVFGAVCMGALLVLAMAGRWQTVTLTSVVALLLLLQAREMRGTWHRLAGLVPAAVALLVLLLRWTVDLRPIAQVGVLVGLIGLAGIAVAGAQVLPGRRLVPRWGRWGDILQWICALAVLSLVFAVTGFYGVVTTWL
jgi:type VII secretion integral membrane protein EccD